MAWMSAAQRERANSNINSVWNVYRTVYIKLTSINVQILTNYDIHNDVQCTSTQNRNTWLKSHKINFMNDISESNFFVPFNAWIQCLNMANFVSDTFPCHNLLLVIRKSCMLKSVKGTTQTKSTSECLYIWIEIGIRECVVQEICILTTVCVCAPQLRKHTKIFIANGKFKLKFSLLFLFLNLKLNILRVSCI